MATNLSSALKSKQEDGIEHAQHLTFIYMVGMQIADEPKENLFFLVLSSVSARLCRFYQAIATKRTLERQLKGTIKRVKSQIIFELFRWHR